MKFRLHAFLSVVVLSVSGCAAAALPAVGLAPSSAPAASTPSESVHVGTAAATIPSPSFFAYAAESSKLQFIGTEALLSGSPRLEAEIIEEQCRYDTPDPPLLISDPRPKNGWAFAGRLDQAHTMHAMAYRNVLTLGLREGQQLNLWPVNLIALSDLPDAYLAQRIGLATNPKLDKTVSTELADQYVANANRLRRVVERLERRFDPQRDCLHQR